MKLLFINHHRKSKTAFRAGNLAKRLATRGHRITLMCIADRERLRFREYEEDGVRFVESPDMLFGKLRSGWDPWCAWKRCQRLRLDATFDLVHAFETRPATIYPVQSLRRRRWMPLVIDWIDWWGRGGLIQEQRPFWYRVFFGALETHYEEHFRRQADGTTVISHALGDRAESLGVERSTIFWIPGGAPVDLLKPLPQAVARQRFGLPQDCFILGFFALDVTFDAELVFHATRIVLKSHPQTLLIMTGNKSSQLEELAARTGIGRSFRHFGRRPYNEELAALFSCADVFLLPFTDKIANRGRWPNKIGDYLCLGRPTVTNPVGEMKILFEQEAVGLLAGESPGQMAEAILRLAHNQDLCLRMGDRARRVAEEKFAWPRIAEMLEECYRITADRFLARAAPL